MSKNHRNSKVAAVFVGLALAFKPVLKPLTDRQKIVEVGAMDNTLSLSEIVERIKNYGESTRETGRRLHGYLRAVEKYRTEFNTTAHYETTRDFMHQCINLFAGYHDRLAEVARELPHGIKQRHVYLLSRICESGKELFAESSKFKFQSGRARNKLIAVLVHRRISDAILSQLREYLHYVNPEEPLAFEKPTGGDDLQNVVVQLNGYLAVATVEKQSDRSRNEQSRRGLANEINYRHPAFYVENNGKGGTSGSHPGKDSNSASNAHSRNKLRPKEREHRTIYGFMKRNGALHEPDKAKLDKRTLEKLIKALDDKHIPLYRARNSVARTNNKNWEDALDYNPDLIKSYLSKIAKRVGTELLLTNKNHNRLE